jgi:glycosyltransferase involved in cell wall biosynthesis
LIVSQYFWPENFRINDLAQEWVKRGHRVSVLTGVPNYPQGHVFESYQADPQAFAQFQGAAVHRVPMLPRGQGGLRLLLNYMSFVCGAALWGPWLLRRTPVDVIFVFEPSPVTVGLPAVWLGRLKKAPVVFWALDLWPETLAAVGVLKSTTLLAGVGRMVRYIYNQCTLVLGQSRAFLGSMAKYCADSTKIRYFPSWAEQVYDDEQSQPAPEVPEQNHGLTVLFAGNVGEAQDWPAVLDAAQRLKEHADIRWVIVGDGRQWAWLQAEIVRRGLVDQVLLPGRFEVERMPSFYAHADALLVSLKKDPVFAMTIPGKVQSYLMSGIPVLGMLDGEGAAVIQEAQAGLACPAGDPDALAQAVLQLKAMPPEQRIQWGANGRQYAQKEFDRTLLMNRLEQMLMEAVSSYKAKNGARVSQ